MTAVRALSIPRALERVHGFLTFDERRIQFPYICKSTAEFRKKWRTREDEPNSAPKTSLEYFEYRYPFYGIETIEKAMEVYHRIGRADAIVALRELVNDQYFPAPPKTPEEAFLECSLDQRDQVEPKTAAWRAFAQGRTTQLAEQYMKWGGCFAIGESQERFFAEHWPPVVVGHPTLSSCVRVAKWTYTADNKKRDLLQTVLQDAADKADFPALQWVNQKCRALDFFSLDLFPALQLAAFGGHADFVKGICEFLDVRKLSAQQKEKIVEYSVELGYPELLCTLSDLGFPVTEPHKKRMESLLAMQESCKAHVSFPEAAHPSQHAFRGGDSNKEIREKEYTLMVGYVCDYIQRGGSFRQCLENLRHRRRRMAVLCNVITTAGTSRGVIPWDVYGTPTDREMYTPYQEFYEEFGEAIRERYAGQLPCTAYAEINGKKIPLTKLCEDLWVHPDGTHRKEVMEEIDRLGQILRPSHKKDQETLINCLLEAAFLISHMPPSLRGTPIIMRASIDGISLLNGFSGFDSAFELNCYALTFTTVQEMKKDFWEHSKFVSDDANEDDQKGNET